MEIYMSLRDFRTIKVHRFEGLEEQSSCLKLLDYMTEEYLNDQTGEVDFLKTYKAIQERFPLYGTILKGIPCDLGTWEGYYYYLPTILRFLRAGERLMIIGILQPGYLAVAGLF